MFEKSLTPQKELRTTARQTTALSYSRGTQEIISRIPPASEMAILKDYESLKLQVRQLEAKNRSLSSEIEQLLHEKNYNEAKYIQKVNFEEESLSQFHKEKNYQLELQQIKHEEDLNKLRRENELLGDEFEREVKRRDYVIKEKDEQNRYLELRNNELRADYEALTIEFSRSREANSVQTETITHNEFKIKKLEMLVEELDLMKTEMEEEIRTLLDVEAQKTLELQNLENQLINSEQNERRLLEKLNMLSQNFAELENHISVMKQKLVNSDEDNYHILQKLDKSEAERDEKERIILDLNEQENHLRLELEEHQKRELRREKEVIELMNENERLYKELNNSRHRLHEFGITYGVDI